MTDEELLAGGAELSALVASYKARQAAGAIKVVTAGTQRKRQLETHARARWTLNIRDPDYKRALAAYEAQVDYGRRFWAAERNGKLCTAYELGIVERVRDKWRRRTGVDLPAETIREPPGARPEAPPPQQ